MNLSEALKAMCEGKEVTHKVLLRTRTKSLRIIACGYYIDKEGYILIPSGVVRNLKLACFKKGWEIVENNELQ